LLVPEEFAFEQIRRHGRTIHLEEAALAASRQLVNQHRRDFLAGTAFTEDKNWNVGARHKSGLRFDLSHALAGSTKDVFSSSGISSASSPPARASALSEASAGQQGRYRALRMV
jgi:hypothetical protein